MQELLSATAYQTIAPSKISWRELLLLAGYHLRMLKWWLFLLMALGFMVAGLALWLTVRSGTPVALDHGNELSRFVLEGGVGIIAGILTSSLVVGDPALEVTLTTRAGVTSALLWRYLLTCLFLLICSIGYLLWSFSEGITYAAQQTPLFLLMLWLTPTLLMSMLGLTGALLTRNAALGTVIAVLPLMADLFLKDSLLDLQWYRPFFIPFTIWEHDASDWWLNRCVLLACAILLALWCWRRLNTEEKLLGKNI